MVNLSPAIPARLAMHVGDDVFVARPLRLTGHEASVVLERAVGASRLVELHLDWNDGAHTQIPATVRSVAANGRLAELDLHGIQGDWRPFLDWLGRDLA